MSHTTTEKDILNSWMPNNETDSPLVRNQINDRFLEVPQKSSLWYLPHLDSAILWTTCDDVIIVWTPLDVEHGRFVTNHQWGITVYATNL